MNNGELQPLLSRALPIGKTRQTDFITNNGIVRRIPVRTF